MKKFFFLLSVCACLIACKNNCTYTINAMVEQGAEIGDTVYLQYIDKGRIYSLGQTMIENGTFSFKGEKCEPQLCYVVSVKNGKVRSNAEIYVEPGDISLYIGAKRYKVTGTFLNTRLQEYNDSLDVIDKMFMNFYEKSKVKTLSVKAAEEADKGMKVLSIVRDEYVTRFMEKNIDNLVSTYILSKNYETINPEKGIKFISMMPEENKCDTVIKHIENTFRNKIATAEGNSFLDFDAYSNVGKRVKLSDYVGKGKITVLNIWSTTGRNVQSDVAEFKALADTYKGKVEFVGFAIDRDVTAWNNAIKKYEMWWSCISDMQGWNSKAVFSYGVNSFPYNIVFDAYGTILRKGVKIADIYSVIDEEMKR